MFAQGQRPPDTPLVEQARPVADSQEQPLDEQAIIITGSRIPQPNLTAVSPVTVVSDLEVQPEGGTLVEEVLNHLPQVAPSQGAHLSNDATGTATVDLRNLGAERTLVLINGRRLGPVDHQQRWAFAIATPVHTDVNPAAPDLNHLLLVWGGVGGRKGDSMHQRR